MSENTSTTKKKESSEAKSSSTTSSDSTSSASTGEGSSTKTTGGGGGGSRPISYFSSVSTDEYRSGWDNIFRNGSEPATAAKPARRKAPARKAKAPVRIELSLDDLDADLRAGLEAAARARAKDQRVSYDKRAQAGAVDWRLVCEIRR